MDSVKEHVADDMPPQVLECLAYLQRLTPTNPPLTSSQLFVERRDSILAFTGTLHNVVHRFAAENDAPGYNAVARSVTALTIAALSDSSSVNQDSLE